MKKEKRYNYDKIEICRNCHGLGRIMGMKQCHVCEGSGMVKKVVNIEVTVEPFVIEA